VEFKFAIEENIKLKKEAEKRLEIKRKIWYHFKL